MGVGLAGVGPAGFGPAAIRSAALRSAAVAVMAALTGIVIPPTAAAPVAAASATAAPVAAALATATPEAAEAPTGAAPTADKPHTAPTGPPSRAVPSPSAGAGPPTGTAAATAPSVPAPDAPGPGPSVEIGAAEAQPTYAWPLLPQPAVLTPFGAPENPFWPGHRGVDLAGSVGQPVRAARGGTVVFAGPVAGHGVVSVQHDDGLRTTYEPLAPIVHAGAVVATGAVLGTLVAGHRGCASPCLHWGLRRDRLEYVDPLVLLRPPRVRLLPVPDPWPDP
jgi:murein DD-endopeptidase MepM/ murein hydrolase activator NlpD